MVASELGFRSLGVQDAIFKGDEEHGIRGRVQPDPAIERKIPGYTLHRGEELEGLFAKLSSIDGGAEFPMREPGHGIGRG